MHSDPAPQFRRLAARLGVTLAILAACLWFLGTRLQDIDGAALAQSLSGLHPLQWGFGLFAVFLAFLAVGRQERVILHHFGFDIDRLHVTTAAMATAGVSQCLGFGPVVGAMIRARLLPDLGLRQSFMVSAATTMGFFGGAGLVAATFLALNGSLWAGLGLVLALGLILARNLAGERSWRGIRLPGTGAILALMGWVAVDLLCLSFAFWVLLPWGSGPGWVEVVAAFITSLALGLMSGSPAGTGAFEALVILQLPQMAPEPLLAGLLAFRGAAYALPAALGACWTLVGRSLLRAPRPGPQRLDPASVPFAALDRAEVQLVRQGDLELLRDRMGQLWATTVLGAQRALIGDPVVPVGRRHALSPGAEICRREGRGALFYKIGARQALAARRAGMAVLRIASEAVIQPAAHSTEGPRHAGLRRKLRHAGKAGIVVRERQLDLELAIEMAGLARVWARAHGGERGLTTGRWGVTYVSGQRLFVAQDATGRLQAFATFHACEREWVLDLIRFGKTVPDGTLYLIVQTALMQAKAEGVARFSLAAVPTESFGLEGMLGRRLRPFSQRARGLYQFKSTFAPTWEPRYAAAPGWLGLLGGLLLLARAIRQKRAGERAHLPETRITQLADRRPPRIEVEDRPPHRRLG